MTNSDEKKNNAVLEKKKPIAVYFDDPLGDLTGNVTADIISPYLCFSLVVEREDVVSPARLALSDQKHPVSLLSRALNQVGRFDTRDGPMEPGVGQQEVIRLLGDLLGRGERGGTCWRDEDVVTLRTNQYLDLFFRYRLSALLFVSASLLSF